MISLILNRTHSNSLLDLNRYRKETKHFLMIKAPFSITVDTEGNRFVSPAYKPLALPAGHEIATINPMVMCAIRDIHEAIEAYKAGNQQLVNDILSRYY